jgi:hypothetical protein
MNSTRYLETRQVANSKAQWHLLCQDSATSNNLGQHLLAQAQKVAEKRIGGTKENQKRVSVEKDPFEYYDHY